MPRKTDREKELENMISKWKAELEIYEKSNTDAAIVERRNLLNLINNAARELEELHKSIGDVEQGKLEDLTLEEVEKEFEEAEKKIKKEEEDRNVQMNVLGLRIERLKEEQEMYIGDKAVYEEYAKTIEETEKELEKLKSKDTLEYRRKIESQINEEKDKAIKKATSIRMKKEKEIENKKLEISKKQIEVQELLAKDGIEEAMVEKELADGTKVKTPKILEIYKEIEKLQEDIRLLTEEKDKCQKFIDKLKGIKEKEKPRELDPEEVKYFHGQGDLPERGENGRKDNIQANNEYFGIGRRF